jgi:hypothetical protein
MITWEGVLRFTTHGRGSLIRALAAGWHAGARYTNLRDVKGLPFEGRGFLDIDWKRYDFDRHLHAAQATRPLMTVARDVVHLRQLKAVLHEAEQLSKHAKFVIIVPKAPGFAGRIEKLVPREFVLGFSVPTRYGGTKLAPSEFSRPVHLLGGRPDVQRRLAELMPVVSLDCNRFTLDATFGDYFDGEIFRPHPVGGYFQCLDDSLNNISNLWSTYARWNGLVENRHRLRARNKSRRRVA